MAGEEHYSRKTQKRRALDDSARMLQLITAAEDVFLTKGYHAATMNDVARAAGMSKKTVYQLVASKEDLFGALLTHQQNFFKLPAPGSATTPRDILILNLLLLAQAVFSSKQIALVRLIMAEHTHSPALGRMFHQMRVVKTRSRLEQCLHEIASGSELKTADVRELSAMLFGMALGEFHLGVLIGFRPAPTQTALKRRITRAVDLFLTENSFLLKTIGPVFCANELIV